MSNRQYIFLIALLIIAILMATGLTVGFVSQKIEANDPAAVIIPPTPVPSLARFDMGQAIRVGPVDLTLLSWKKYEEGLDDNSGYIEINFLLSNPGDKEVDIPELVFFLKDGQERLYRQYATTMFLNLPLLPNEQARESVSFSTAVDAEDFQIILNRPTGDKVLVDLN